MFLMRVILLVVDDTVAAYKEIWREFVSELRVYYESRIRDKMPENKMRMNIVPKSIAYVLRFWILDPVLAPPDFTYDEEFSARITLVIRRWNPYLRVCYTFTGAMFALLYLLALPTESRASFVPYPLTSAFDELLDDDDFIGANFNIYNAAERIRSNFDIFRDHYKVLSNDDMLEVWRTTFDNNPNECARLFLSFAFDLMIPIGEEPGTRGPLLQSLYHPRTDASEISSNTS